MIVCLEQAVERDELKLEGKLCQESFGEQLPSVVWEQRITLCSQGENNSQRSY